MRIFIVDAFSTEPFSGNPAGVVLLPPDVDFPSDTFMGKLASELRHSETVFVKPLTESRFHLRYFTAVEEVPLCGHATIAAFTALREAENLPLGDYEAATAAGLLRIGVEQQFVWMDMAAPRYIHHFTEEEALELYDACGLSLELSDPLLPPVIADAGLPDILLAVRDAKTLESLTVNVPLMTKLSKDYAVAGFHVYACEEGAYAARCRNFAPALGILEESATGTANGALAFHLHEEGRISSEEDALFLQGESMGKPSIVSARIHSFGAQKEIRIGGAGTLILEATLYPPLS